MREQHPDVIGRTSGRFFFHDVFERDFLDRFGISGSLFKGARNVETCCFYGLGGKTPAGRKYLIVSIIKVENQQKQTNKKRLVKKMREDCTCQSKMKDEHGTVELANKVMEARLC